MVLPRGQSRRRVGVARGRLGSAHARCIHRSLLRQELMDLSQYRAIRPAPRSLLDVPGLVLRLLDRFWRLLVHTVRPYQPMATPPAALSQKSPSGMFSSEHLPMCERLATQSAGRTIRLEQKATTLL